MGNRPTIKEIANEAGVSSATVSRFINKSGYVNEETAARIQKAVEKFNFRPSQIARSLKTQSTHNLALIVPDIQNPFYSRMANRVQHLLLSRGYTVTLLDSGGEPAMEMKCLHVAASISVDGILFASISAQLAILEELEKLRIPVVMINSYDSCPFDSVHGVRCESTYLATKHLIRLGHRRIGYAGGTMHTAIENSRYGGYCKAMQEAGLKVDPSMVFEMGFNSDSGKKSGAYFTALEQMPTAICCGNDLIALGVLQVFQKKGIRVPQDVSLTGVDNIIYGELSSPPLTSVINDSDEFADKAVSALFDRIEGRYTGEPREYRIERQLVVRGSTAECDGERKREEP